MISIGPTEQVQGPCIQIILTKPQGEVIDQNNDEDTESYSYETKTEEKSKVDCQSACKGLTISNNLFTFIWSLKDCCKCLSASVGRRSSINSIGPTKQISMNFNEQLKQISGPSIKIILSNPQGEVVEQSTGYETETEDLSSGSVSPGSEACSNDKKRAKSLPEIFQTRQSIPNIESYFKTWRDNAQKRGERGLNGEWSQKLTCPVSLEKMSEGLQKRNSVLEDSFI